MSFDPSELEPITDLPDFNPSELEPVVEFNPAELEPAVEDTMAKPSAEMFQPRTDFAVPESTQVQQPMGIVSQMLDQDVKTPEEREEEKLEKVSKIEQSIDSEISKITAFEALQNPGQSPDLNKPFSESIHAGIDNWRNAYLKSMKSMLEGKKVEKSLAPIAEYWNNLKDENEEEISVQDVLANIGRGITNLMTLPVSQPAELGEYWDKNTEEIDPMELLGEMQKPYSEERLSITKGIGKGSASFIYHMLEFFAVENVTMLNNLLTASQVNPIVQTRIALGDESAKEDLKKAQNAVANYPVETLLAPFMVKQAVKAPFNFVNKVDSYLSKQSWYTELIGRDKTIVSEILKNKNLNEAGLARESSLVKEYLIERDRKGGGADYAGGFETWKANKGKVVTEAEIPKTQTKPIEGFKEVKGDVPAELKNLHKTNESIQLTNDLKVEFKPERNIRIWDESEIVEAGYDPVLFEEAKLREGEDGYVEGENRYELETAATHIKTEADGSQQTILYEGATRDAYIEDAIVEHIFKKLPTENPGLLQKIDAWEQAVRLASEELGVPFPSGVELFSQAYTFNRLGYATENPSVAETFWLPEDIITEFDDLITPEAITSISGDTPPAQIRLGGDPVDSPIERGPPMEMDQTFSVKAPERKLRTHEDLEVLIPEETRLVGTKDEGQPYKHVSGKSFSELDLESTQTSPKINDTELEAIWKNSLQQSNLTIADIPESMNPNTIEFWNNSLALNDKARYWYEISGETTRDRLIDKEPEEILSVFDLIGATSIQANPIMNIERTISVLSEQARGVPVTTGLASEKPVKDALFGTSLEGLKTGNFSDTFAYLIGIKDKTPLSTNDRQVASTFNIPGELLGQDPRLYEVLSRFYINLRDNLNAKLPEGADPYQTWQLQALGWVEERMGKGNFSSDDLQLAFDLTLKKLVDNGVPLNKNSRGEYVITNDDLLNPKITEILSPTAKRAQDSRVATIEVGTTQTEQGARAFRIVDELKTQSKKEQTPAVQARINKSLDNYKRIEYRGLAALGKRRGGKKSLVDEIFSTITDENVSLSRIKSGPGVFGSFEGNVSPNIRIPMRTGMGKDSRELTLQEAESALSFIGEAWNQDAMAASKFTPTNEKGDTKSVFMREYQNLSSESIEAIEKLLNKKSEGKEFSINGYPSPNGYVLEVNPHFGEKGIEGPDLQVLINSVESIVGDYNKNHFNNKYESSYISGSDYDTKNRSNKDAFIERLVDSLREDIGGSRSRARQAIVGRKELGSIFTKKSDIGRARRVRDKYRTFLSNTKQQRTELRRIAGSVDKQKGTENNKSARLLKQITGETFSLKVPEGRKPKQLEYQVLPQENLSIKAPIRSLIQLKNRFLQRTQDRLRNLEKYQKFVNIKDESMDAYMESELYSSRTRARIDKADEFEQKFLSKLKGGFFKWKPKVSVNDFGYYLYAKHARERDIKMKEKNPKIMFDASGWNKEVLGTPESWLKGGDKYIEGMEELSQEFRRNVIDKNLDVLFEGELIDLDTYNFFKSGEVYKNYVPLKGMANTETFMNVGKGFTGVGKLIKGAKGRSTLANNPMAQALSDLNVSIVRSEKNRFSQAFYRLVENNPAMMPNGQVLWEVKPIQYKPSYDKHGDMKLLPENVDTKKEMLAYFDGKPKKIIVNDPELMQGINAMGMGAASKWLMLHNSWLRRTLTGWNPVFWIDNFRRDIQTNITSHVLDKRTGVGLKTAAYTPLAINGIRNFQYGDGKTKWAKIYEDYIAQGGKMGWLDTKTVEQRLKDLESAINKGSFRRGISATAKFIDNFNNIFEQCTRVATYQALLEKGYSKKRASQIAKNITVNFNKKGEMGSLLNNHYLFYNAATQGTYNTHKRMFTTKRGAMYVASMIGFGYYMAVRNRTENEKAWDKISDFDKYSKLLIPHPFTDAEDDTSKLPIPLAYGYSSPYAWGVILEEHVNGGLTLGTATAKMFKAFVAGAMPVQGGNVIDMVMPTYLKPASQTEQNIKWTGSPIYPEDKYGQTPDSEKYFDSANPISIAFARKLNKATGGTRKREGGISISPEVIDHVTEFYGGGIMRLGKAGYEISQGIDISDTPIGRIFKIKPNKWTAKSEFFRLKNKSVTKELTEGEVKRFNKFLNYALEDGEIYEDQAEEYKDELEKNQKVLKLEDKYQDLLAKFQKFPRKFNKKGFTREDVKEYQDLLTEVGNNNLITEDQHNRAVVTIRRAYMRLERLKK